MRHFPQQNVKLLTNLVRTCLNNGSSQALSRCSAYSTAAYLTLQRSVINCQKSTPTSVQRQQMNSPTVVRWLHSKFDDSNSTVRLNEYSAKELISNLSDSERYAIKLAMDQYDAEEMKKSFEIKLAASQWRTRFGRLTRVPALGEVDPTGSFCAVPEDWLQKKLVENAQVPSRTDLWRIFFVNAAPFVVFGFLDNFTMIVVGDYIECALGLCINISTMAAAGLGNTISDVMGLGSAVYVERGCRMLGLTPPELTQAQYDLKSSRNAISRGRIIGITVGCLLGMLPLLLITKEKDDDEKDDKLVPLKT